MEGDQEYSSAPESKKTEVSFEGVPWSGFVEKNKEHLDAVLCNQEGKWIFVRSETPGKLYEHGKLRVYYGEAGEKLNQENWKLNKNKAVAIEEWQDLLKTYDNINAEWSKDALKKAEEVIKYYSNGSDYELCRFIRESFKADELDEKIEKYKKEIENLFSSERWENVPDKIRDAISELRSNGLNKEADEFKQKAREAYLGYARLRLEVALKVKGEYEHAENIFGSGQPFQSDKKNKPMETILKQKSREEALRELELSVQDAMEPNNEGGVLLAETQLEGKEKKLTQKQQEAVDRAKEEVDKLKERKTGDSLDLLSDEDIEKNKGYAEAALERIRKEGINMEHQAETIFNAYENLQREGLSEEAKNFKENIQAETLKIYEFYLQQIEQIKQERQAQLEGTVAPEPAPQPEVRLAESEVVPAIAVETAELSVPLQEAPEEPEIVPGTFSATEIPTAGAGMVEQIDSEQGILTQTEVSPQEQIPPPKIPGKVAVALEEVEPPKGRPELEKKKIKKYIISTDQIVERYARSIAEEKTRELLHRPEENMRSNSRIKSIWNHISAPFRHPIHFARKSWVRMAESGYDDKFYREALRDITENQNLLLEVEASARLGRPIQSREGDKNIHYEILDKIIEQYSNEVAELEEQGNQITNPEVNAAFQKLIADCYLYGWDRPVFEGKLRDLINNDLKPKGLITNDDFLGGSARNEDEVSTGRMYASDLWATVEDYRSHIEEKMKEMAGEHELTPEQEEKLKEHLAGIMELDIHLGAKISDIHNRRPQGTLNATDRLISWAQRAPILRRIAPNPGTMAVIGAGVGTLISRRLASKTAMAGAAAVGLATGAWIPVIAAGVTAGAFGALRRNMELKKDRAMHQRQKALGQEHEDFRRKGMDRYQYDVRSATDLREELRLIREAGEYAELSDDQKNQLADMLARFKREARNDINYRTGRTPNRTADLISVSVEEGGKYGTTLVSKTELKKELYEYLRVNGLMKGADHHLAGGPDFSTMFDNRYRELAENITRADRAFMEYRIKSAYVIGLLTAMGGSVAAMAGQEFMGFLRGNENGYTALDSLKDLWREHISGRPTKMSETVSQLFFQGQKLSPGMHNFEHSFIKDGHSVKEAFKLFVNVDQDTGIPRIDSAKSVLPAGFTLSPDGTQLLHQIPGSREIKEFTNWQEFSKTLGYSADQKVSYGEGFYQKTPPEKGIRAMVESAKNLFNNKKLHANYTELMMSYRQGDGGKVIVDASKIFGKELVGAAGGESIKLEDALAKGQRVFFNLALDNNIKGGDGSQFTPIMIPMNPDGTVEVPEKLAEIFFGFENGKLLQGSGKHPGLHQLVLDTGQTRPDGSRIVRGIAATLGEAPDMKAEVTTPGLSETWNIEVEQGKQFDVPYPILFPAHGPRWQLEDNEKEKKRKKKKEKKPSKQKTRSSVSTLENQEDKPKKFKIIDPNDPNRKSTGEEAPTEVGASQPVIKKEQTPPVNSLSGAKSGKIEIDRRGAYFIEVDASNALNKHKGIFENEKNLKSIISRNKANKTDLKGIIDKIKKLKENEKNNTPSLIKDIAEFSDYYENCKNKFPSTSGMSFPEFIFCLQKGLEKIVSGKRRKTTS